MIKIIQVPEAEQKRVIAHWAFEIKEVKDDGTFAGYGSTFGNVDQGGDICDSKCFDETLVEYKNAGLMPHMFFSHNINEPIGDYTKMETDQKGLYCEGKLWLGEGIPKAQQTYRMLKSKTGKGLSIGYSTKEYAMDEETGIRTLLKVKLHEISPTPFPMNEKAEITAVKTMLISRDKLGIRDAEELLRDVGFSHSEAKRFMALLCAGMKESWDATQEILEACKNLTR